MHLFKLIVISKIFMASEIYAGFGGQTVLPGDPLNKIIVAIGNSKSHICTGSFVAKDVVLTAAHCAIPDKNGDAAAGVGSHVYPINTPDGFDPIRGEKIKIEQVSFHHAKDDLDIWISIGENDKYLFDNPDMALLKLSHPYKEAIPAKIASIARENDVYSAGFGRGNENWQRPSRIKFNIINDYEVSREIGNDFSDLTEGNTHDFIQALNLQIDLLIPYFTFVKSNKPGTQTLCYGDSGAPLYKMNGGKMNIIGIASLFFPHPNKGNSSCDFSYLNVFAKTEPHLKWLKDEINRLSSDKKIQQSAINISNNIPQLK